MEWVLIFVTLLFLFFPFRLFAVISLVALCAEIEFSLFASLPANKVLEYQGEIEWEIEE